jgi:hypothetical protein
MATIITLSHKAQNSSTANDDNGYNQGYFCDGTHWNAISKFLSQKDTNRNGVPELLS